MREDDIPDDFLKVGGGSSQQATGAEIDAEEILVGLHDVDILDRH
ncbi:hypothetical protein [Synechococcus sp. PCC 7336]|nr:hypothetical protein [Synechococcus sp. PCC 7336]